jgi:antitoxin component YwqK of YwqJK toxin-antitoxin module
MQIPSSHLGNPIDKPPKLPFDILTMISLVSVTAYRALLALPRFGRSSLIQRNQLRYQHFFIRHTIKVGTKGFTSHKWFIGIYSQETRKGYLIHRSNGPAKIRTYPNDQTHKEEWYFQGQRHRRVGPAYTSYRPNGHKKCEEWYIHGIKHRSDSPAYIYYHNNGQRQDETWFQNGQIHRPDGPALVYYNENAQKEREIWYLHGLRQRPTMDLGPTVIAYYTNGQKQEESWYLDDKIHRQVNLGPALIYYYPNGQIMREEYYWDDVLHRPEELGPARICYNTDGTKDVEEWYLNDQIHRIHGPAIVKSNGKQKYYLHDKKMTREEHAEAVRKMKGL